MANETIHFRASAIFGMAGLRSKAYEAGLNVEAVVADASHYDPDSRYTLRLTTSDGRLVTESSYSSDIHRAIEVWTVAKRA